MISFAKIIYYWGAGSGCWDDHFTIFSLHAKCWMMYVKDNVSFAVSWKMTNFAVRKNIAYDSGKNRNND
jgi:hypothetical protein